MPTEVPYRIALAALLAGLLAHRAWFLRRFPQALSKQAEAPERGGAGILLPLLGSGAALFTLTYIVRPPWVSWAALPLPAWLRWIGAGVGLVGLLLLHSAQRELGAHWSVTARLIEDHRLVNTGPYSRVRHPIYTALLLIQGSPLLIAANWAVGATCLGVTLLDVMARARREEALLLSHFGSRYRDYMAVTGGFVPRLRR